MAKTTLEELRQRALAWAQSDQQRLTDPAEIWADYVGEHSMDTRLAGPNAIDTRHPLGVFAIEYTS